MCLRKSPFLYSLNVRKRRLEITHIAQMQKLAKRIPTPDDVEEKHVWIGTVNK